MRDSKNLTWFERQRRLRAERALERQLEYQFKKARRLKPHAQQTDQDLAQRTAEKRLMLEDFRPISPEDRILEVGSGAHGLIFHFGNSFGIGIDPLAVHYKQLFPTWQQNARTIAAAGEQLPFANNSFDVVLCDNVVDHAERPEAVVRETVRVLKSGGLLYFTVNVHHPIYAAGAKLHNAWNAVGWQYEITPFADHTVHFTVARVRKIFALLPLQILRQTDTIESTKQFGKNKQAVNLEMKFKRLFYKNAQFEIVAIRN